MEIFKKLMLEVKAKIFAKNLQSPLVILKRLLLRLSFVLNCFPVFLMAAPCYLKTCHMIHQWKSYVNLF